MTPDDLIQHVEKCLDLESSKLDMRVLTMTGFGSEKVLHFLNNLCSLGDCRYLEFGTWAGRSLAAAAWKNTGCFLGVENFHVDPKINRELSRNIEPIPNARVLAMDFRAFKLVDGLTWDVFFYDADHSREATAEGITTVSRSLRLGIMLVDDLELGGYEDKVFPGLQDGLSRGHYLVHQEWLLKKAFGWHEGLWVGVVESHDAKAVAVQLDEEHRRAREREIQIHQAFTRAWTG